MGNAIITFYIVSSNQNIDIETPIDISINDCIEVLYAANLLPTSDSYQFDASDTGESWEKADGNKLLKELIIGDGSMIRIREGGDQNEESSSRVLS